MACRRCPRLRAHCRQIARAKRRAFRHARYWGKPVPGFGDPEARIVFVGLAPAAHGANRTGRMFTGDRSGAWLYGALYRAGLASQPDSVAPGDGLELRGAFVTAALRCAPPQNRPRPEELRRCARFLERELRLLPRLRVIVALGGIAWRAVLALAVRAAPESVPRPRPPFAHGARVRLKLHRRGRPVVLLGSYHPSQQNTFTGRLTRRMLDRLVARAVRWAERGEGVSG